MKVYISGPMSGKPKYNRAAFTKAAVKLRKMGFDVISPIELDEADGYSTDDPNLLERYWEFLARDVQVIGDSDLCAIFVLDDWWKSTGARLEVFQALLLRIPIFSYDDRYQYETADVMRIINRSILEVK